MATLIPDIPKDCAYGERLTYERLGRDLDRDWVILHSLGLHGHENKLWGEADIVILSTRGIFALEVKGGKVSCRNGVWTFGDPQGKHYTKREDPWTQAKGTMYAVKAVLEDADPTFRHILFGFGVVMPMETFTATGAEIEPAVLLDRREFRRHLGFFVGQLHHQWTGVYEARHGRTPRLPDLALVRRARELLRPDVESAFDLGGWLTGVESKLVSLTRDQIRASRRIAANPRTVVRGRAGTGKTLLAVERARLLAAEGRRVLYLCFNQLLAAHVRGVLHDEAAGESVEVCHIHAFYQDVITRAGMQGRLADAGDPKTLFAETFPRTFVDAAIELDLAPWDVLVVDEAQDILTPDHLEAFDLLLGVPGINRGRWHIFLDPQQNIFGNVMLNEVQRRLEEAQPAFDDLFQNCRNTREVAVHASIVSGIDLAIEGAADGIPCGNVYAADDDGLRAALEKCVADLIGQGVPPAQIAVLSTRRRENSVVARVKKLAGQLLVDVLEARPGDLVFSTMHAFKGLERPVVLAIDMDELGEPDLTMLHYAGLSRARALLQVFLRERSRPAFLHQSGEFGRRLSQAG